MVGTLSPSAPGDGCTGDTTVKMVKSASLGKTDLIFRVGLVLINKYRRSLWLRRPVSEQTRLRGLTR
jgi:hypothetical protein